MPLHIPYRGTRNELNQMLIDKDEQLAELNRVLDECANFISELEEMGMEAAASMLDAIRQARKERRARLKDMKDAPRDGSHFLALARIGVEDTDKEVLEWREIWYEPDAPIKGHGHIFGPTVWKAENGSDRFSEDCFVGWTYLPPKE